MKNVKKPLAFAAGALLLSGLAATGAAPYAAADSGQAAPGSAGCCDIVVTDQGSDRIMVLDGARD